MNFNFSQLVKAAKKHKINENDYKLAVLGDSATQFLSKAIEGCGMMEGFPINVMDADYNQISIQAYDDSSELYEFKPDAVLVWMCTQKLFEEFCHFTGDRKKFADLKMQEIANINNMIYQKSNAMVIQFNFAYENDGVFGNFGLKIQNSFAFQLQKLNMLMMEWASEHKFFCLIDINRIRNIVSYEKFDDPKMYFSSKLAIAVEGFPEMAHNVIQVIRTLKGFQPKCIVLDLDNTLWGGVIGDDGINNIELGELGTGRAFTEFQMWLRELKKRGIILCICSKNDENTAKQPFLEHPDMILRLDDITLFISNWNNKADNIRKIQQTLNIGMDSIVFIDDNPFERNLVKTLIPEIIVPEMPEDPSMYCRFMKEQNIFETASYSDNDAERTEQYKSEMKRNEIKTKFNDFNDYLKQLGMIGAASYFDKHYFPRIAQLTQRTNQFNLRTIRYSESDIERFYLDDKYIKLYFTLKDKFGEYGLVSVVIMEKKKDSVFIDTFLMSCRVLKRGMEQFIVNSIVDEVKKSGYNTIQAEYIPTAKNKMVRKLYQQFGFVETDENKYTLNVSQYVYKEHFINFSDENRM